MSVTSERVTPRRVYRSSGTLWAALGSTAGAVLFLALGIANNRRRAVLLGGAFVLLLLAWRMWRVGIRIEDDYVTVATVLGSRRVPWGEVDHFAVMPLGRYPYVGYAVLRDGRKYGTFGLSTSVRQTEANRLRVQEPIDQLNRVLAAKREAAAQAAGG